MYRFLQIRDVEKGICSGSRNQFTDKVHLFRIGPASDEHVITYKSRQVQSSTARLAAPLRQAIRRRNREKILIAVQAAPLRRRRGAQVYDDAR